MLKNFNYSLIALFFVTIFSSCNKEMDEVRPMNASMIQASQSVETSYSIFTSLTTANPNELVTISGKVTSTSGVVVNCGKVQIKRSYNDEEAVDVSEGGVNVDGEGNYSLGVKHDVLGAGKYIYSAHYISRESPNAPSCDFKNSNKGLTVQVDVNDNCTGVSLLASGASIVGNKINFTFTLTNFSGVDLGNLKLQGGLIAGASNVTTISSEDGEAVRTPRNKNVTVTWEQINVNHGATKTFTVSYDYTGKTQLSDGANVSGNWSLKDANGNTVAASIGQVLMVVTPL